MIDITLKLRTVTPLFISGAEQEQLAELREPSIKGLLRFWYRVIYPLDAEREARIFGGQGKGQGQSAILLRLTGKELSHGKMGDSCWNKTKTAYLGYGVIVRDKIRKQEITTRPYIESGKQFSLNIRFNQLPGCALSDDDKLRLKRAIWAWLMFGGLGARSRNGFGALVVESAIGMEDDDLPELVVNNEEELQKSIQTFVDKIPANPSAEPYPDYTRWSDKTQCLITGQGKNGEEALEKLGNKISALRSKQSTGKLALVNDDCKLMYEFIHSNKKPKSPPLRSAFGLPHNYFFSSSQKGGEVNFMDENGKKGRRASPLFFTVYEFPKPNQAACVVALYLPAKLIPSGEAVRISTGEEGTTGYRSANVILPDDFTAVTQVLDELSKPVNHGLKVYP